MRNHPGLETLALYSWGDLEASDAREVSTHLDECATCREQLAPFVVLREQERAWAEEPLQADLVDVRRRVMARIAAPQRKSWWWIPVAAAACGCLLAVLVVRSQPVIEPLQARVTTPAVPEMVVPAALPRTVRRHPVRKHRGDTFEVLAAADDSRIFKIRTPDPNVVILWESSERTHTE